MNKFAGVIFTIFILIISFLVFLGIRKNNVKNNNEAKQKTEEIVKKEDLRLGVLNLDTFNPILTKNRYVYEMVNLFYDSLIDLSSDYSIKLELAEKIEKMQDLEYRVVLKDVSWNNMKDKLSSEDVLFTVDKIKENSGIYGDNVKNIAEIKIISDREFSIILKEKDPFFISHLNFPIMKKVDDAMFVNANDYGVPYGIGKYFLSKTENNILYFELNKDYYAFKDGNSPYIKKILVSRYKTGLELYNDFKAGNIDILETDKEDVESFLGKFGYHKLTYKGREFTNLAFNCAKINDKNIRKAIAHILDKNLILNEVYGVLDSNYPLDNSFWLGSSFNIDKNLNYARELLEKAGLMQRDGKWTIDGKEIVLNILVNKDNLNSVKAAESIKKQFSDIGLNLNIVLADAETFEKDIREKNYEMAIFTIRTDFSPSMKSFFGLNNYYNYVDPNMTELLKQINEIDLKNEKEIKSVYKKIEEMYLEDIPFIGLYKDKRYYLISNALNGEINPNSHNIFQNFNVWYRK